MFFCVHKSSTHFLFMYILLTMPGRPTFIAHLKQDCKYVESNKLHITSLKKTRLYAS